MSPPSGSYDNGTSDGGSGPTSPGPSRRQQCPGVGDDVAPSSRALKVAAAMAPALGCQGDDDNTTHQKPQQQRHRPQRRPDSVQVLLSPSNNGPSLTPSTPPASSLSTKPSTAPPNSSPTFSGLREDNNDTAPELAMTSLRAPEPSRWQRRIVDAGRASNLRMKRAGEDVE
ncbi:hypothetical protein EDB86DRAFT_3105865 [Lactarius hatsudake]|nr:hypothetical protein EDB86DRAFT_3105865 [Lactarius hatsudake]